MIDGLTFDAETHTYRHSGKIIPSVTQLLKPLSGLNTVPPEILTRAAKFGNAVHKACELDDLHDLGSCPEPVMPYLNAWRKFCDDTGAKWDGIEEQVYNEQYGYAGTLDRVGTVSGFKAVVDLKSSFKLYATVGPQLAAYQKAYKKPTVKRIGVQLKPDGTYLAKSYVSANDWAVFASMATIHRFCAENGIKPYWKDEQ